MEKIAIFRVLIFMFICSCNQAQIKQPMQAMNKFQEFKNKVKFIPDSLLHYPGLAEGLSRKSLSDKINLAADDFKMISESGAANDKDYQEKIKIGLQRFNDDYLNLDTEDRERICLYFEELMDIVGLESSGGYLNNFLYGFDPTKLSKPQ